MFSNRLIPHLFSKKIHASTLKKSLLSLFPYFHFCIFNIKTMHITWLESVIGISKDLFHFNLRYKFLLNYFPLTSLATASYGLTSQFLLTATICHLNHRLYMARLDMQNVFAIFLFTETNPQPFPCLSLLREYVYLLSLTRTMSG